MRLGSTLSRAFLMASTIAVLCLAYLALPTPWNMLIVVGTVPVVFFILFIYPIIRRKTQVPKLDLEFIYMLAHMYSLSTGGPPRAEIFRKVSESGLYEKYAKIFKRIYLLGKEYGYSLADACAIVARDVRDKYLREFLERLSGVLSMGEDIERFLEVEYASYASEYENGYNRTMDAVKVMLGSYTALMASTVFIVINFLLLSFFFGGDPWIVTNTYLGVSLGLAAFILLVRKLLPHDFFENKEGMSLKECDVLKLVLPLSVGLALGMALFIAGSLTPLSVGTAMLAAGLILLAPAILAKIAEGYISEMDRFFPMFIRSYGLHLSAVPSAYRALEPLLEAELGRLKRSLKRLYVRLINGIDPRLCWRMFARESGSELVRKGSLIFIDALEGGSDAAKTGEVLSSLSNLVLRLRRLRTQVYKAFETTIYVLHATSVVLLIFAVKILAVFSGALSNVPTIFPFGTIDERFLSMLTALFITFLIIINAYALNQARVGLKHSIIFHVSLLLLTTGVSLVLADLVIDVIIGSTFSAVTETFTSTSG